MQILARVSVAAGLAAMTAVGAWLLVHRAEDGGAPELVPPPIDDEPVVAVAKDSAPPEEPPVIVENVDGPTWMPPGYVEDISRDKTEELAALVQDWLTNPTGERPVIEYKRGILYIESDEDRGDDGPYPKSAQAEARRVCGSDAMWMREYIRQRYQNDTVSCAGNVCSIGGMEYAPTSSLVFKEVGSEGDRRWALIAWTQVYEAALVQDIVDANYRNVIASMIKLRDTRCAGEPAGFYY